jgi:hypothetical protein
MTFRAMSKRGVAENPSWKHLMVLVVTAAAHVSKQRPAVALVSEDPRHHCNTAFLVN